MIETIFCYFIVLSKSINFLYCNQVLFIISLKYFAEKHLSRLTLCIFLSYISLTFYLKYFEEIYLFRTRLGIFQPPKTLLTKSYTCVSWKYVNIEIRLSATLDSVMTKGEGLSPTKSYYPFIMWSYEKLKTRI